MQLHLTSLTLKEWSLIAPTHVEIPPWHETTVSLEAHLDFSSTIQKGVCTVDDWFLRPILTGKGMILTMLTDNLNLTSSTSAPNRSW